MITLTLPAPCPEPGCGTLLQRALKPGLGVTPHYNLMHPRVAAPKVAGDE